MNEEEKEAIEELEEFIKGPCKTCKYCEAAYKLNRKNIIQLLNLTKKLQKENKELKSLIAHKNGYTKKLEEDLFENCSNYVIPIQKIKDKIEYLDNQKKQWLEDIKLKTSYGEIMFAREVLQELLESEE